MQVNIKDLVDQAGLSDPLYPGKKLVKKYPLPGEYKSHCIVFDWHDSKLLRVELKAGLSGRTLDLKDLKNYPVSYQAPTYLNIVTGQDNEVEAKEDDEEGEEGEEGKGKSGGGKGKKPAKRLEDQTISLKAFGRVMDGEIPTMGEIQKFVIMGKEIAKEAFAQAFENLKEQLHQTKVMAMDLMKGVNDIIVKATPGGGLEARGDETVKYKYDAEKTAGMFGGLTPT
jgi:hypothetical protein